MWKNILFLTYVLIYVGTEPEYEISTVRFPTTFNPEDTQRIIGGTATTIEKHPYAVQILYVWKLFCGGTIITQRHILSAAHCFVQNGKVDDPRFFKVRLGTTVLEVGGRTYEIAQLLPHEDYNKPVLENDISLAVLTRDVRLNRRVKLVLLPGRGEVLPEKSTVTILGWGTTVESDPSKAATALQEVEVFMVSVSECAKRYSQVDLGVNASNIVSNNKTLCAGVPDVGGKDACQGDSGGPLMYGHVQMGVVSWGLGCGKKDYPGIFSSVASYIDWINITVTTSGSSSIRFSAILLTAYVTSLATSSKQE